MFNKKDMMVSLLVAEDMITTNNEEYKKSLSDTREKYNNVINSMKNNSNISGVAELFKSSFTIGESTPHFSNGIQLFTGDEVEFKNGKKGIIVFHNYSYMVYTNCETSKLVTHKQIEEMKRIYFSFSGYVIGDNLKITKHFNELTDGEEIAKGRKGASGFTIKLD